MENYTPFRKNFDRIFCILILVVFDDVFPTDAVEIEKLENSQIAEAVIRVRDGNVHIEAGYDGLFGKIEIFSEKEREKIFNKPKQVTLF